jgi:hypothetical protein
MWYLGKGISRVVESRSAGAIYLENGKASRLNREFKKRMISGM